MNKSEFLRLITVPVVVALITSVTVGLGFITWIKKNPSVIVGYLDQTLVKNTASVEDGLKASRSVSENLIVNAVKKANPAVVAITVSKNVPVYEQYFESVPSPFGNFFGDDFFGSMIPRYRQNGTEKQEIGGGSGFIVSSDGYIVTNRHVVDDEKAEYTVFLNDGTKYDTKVVAVDPVLDLAVLKINGKNLPHLSFANSDAIEVGQSVIAIGNALAEFRNTVSVGIISGLSRSIVASDRSGGSEALDQLIQTDAAINPGNSGGPLLNLSGDVVGVNVAVASGAENIGFALSANSVENVVESVKKHGKIIRPYIGVRYIPVTEELVLKNKLPVNYGVLVQRGSNPTDLAVIPSSPADKAGIVENDIILEVDGVKITEDVSLSSLIQQKRVGDTVELKLNHKGRDKTVSVILEEMK